MPLCLKGNVLSHGELEKNVPLFLMATRERESCHLSKQLSVKTCDSESVMQGWIFLIWEDIDPSQQEALKRLTKSL